VHLLLINYFNHKGNIMKSLWNKFTSLIQSGTISLKKEELRILGELALRVEAIESHLADNDDDTVEKYRPDLNDQAAQVDSALVNVTDKATVD
jgi:hypothetical protein